MYRWRKQYSYVTLTGTIQHRKLGSFFKYHACPKSNNFYNFLKDEFWPGCDKLNNSENKTKVIEQNKKNVKGIQPYYKFYNRNLSGQNNHSSTPLTWWWMSQYWFWLHVVLNFPQDSHYSLTSQQQNLPVYVGLRRPHISVGNFTVMLHHAAKFEFWRILSKVVWTGDPFSLNKTYSSVHTFS